MYNTYIQYGNWTIELEYKYKKAKREKLQLTGRYILQSKYVYNSTVHLTYTYTYIL